VADGPHADLAALGAGACAAAAVMVKQNMLDVAVFALALGAVVGVRRREHVPMLLRRLVLGSAGLAGGLAAILLSALARGTTPWGVWFAMYPFRLRAALVMEHTAAASRWAHLTKMALMWASTGAPLVLVAFLLAILVRRTPPRDRSVGSPAAGTGGAAVVALLVLTVYDAGSVAAGGSYWTHYVLQLAVPTALMAGVLVLRARRVGTVVVAVVVACAASGWIVALQARVPAAGPVVGSAIAAASEPGDAIVSLLGDGSMVATAGLSAPYPYLWSLPAHVLDPHFRRLTALLRSDSAPSWVVVRGPRTVRLMDREGPGRVLQRRYREVTTMCEHPVFLRRDLTRPVPESATACTLPLAPWNAEHATRRWTVAQAGRR
jgi:hypothetical protein